MAFSITEENLLHTRAGVCNCLLDKIFKLFTKYPLTRTDYNLCDVCAFAQHQGKFASAFSLLDESRSGALHLRRLEPEKNRAQSYLCCPLATPCSMRVKAKREKSSCCILARQAAVLLLLVMPVSTSSTRQVSLRTTC